PAKWFSYRTWSLFMSTRRAVPAAVLAVAFACLFFGLGNYLGALQQADSAERLAVLRAEVDQLRRRDVHQVTGTSGILPRGPMDDGSRGAMVADVKRQLQSEMGLLPVTLLRERRDSFVE